jgi:ATP-dependent Clp protease ATP-binding subunit ClpA
MQSKSILENRIQDLESNLKKQKIQFGTQEKVSKRLLEELIMKKVYIYLYMYVYICILFVYV